jgi:fucose permease
MINGEETLQSAARKRLLFLLHAGFLLIGIVTVLLGQILPVLSKRLSLNDREAGYLFVAQFAGSLAGAFFIIESSKNTAICDCSRAALFLRLADVPH